MDLERPSRRLVLMSGGHQTLVAGEDTVTTQPAEGRLPTWVDEVGGGRNTFPRSATQVDSVTDENTLYVRQAPGAQSQPEVFPMSDDADVEVATVAGQVGGQWRVVLVPLSPGTPRSVQDRTVGSTGSRFEVLASAEEARRVVPPGERVGSERESEGGGMPIGDLSETESAGSHHEEVEDDSAEEDVVVSEAGEMPEEEAELEEVPFRLPGVATLRAAFLNLDVVRLTEEFEERASVMKSVTRFLKGPYRIAMRAALEEISEGGAGRTRFARNEGGSCSCFCRGCCCTEHQTPPPFRVEIGSGTAQNRNKSQAL